MANSLANRESLAPLPPDKLPLKGELYAILCGCHEAAVPVGCRSKTKPELPPKAAPTSDYEIFRDKSLCPVCPEDLRTKDRSNRDVPPRAIQMKNLIRFFACGSLYAANRQPAIEYAPRDVMQLVKPTFWQLHLPVERDATGMAIVWSSNREPVHILSRHPNNMELMRNAFGEPRVMVLKAEGHANYCRCPSLLKHNNLENLMFAVSCLPASDIRSEAILEMEDDATGVFSFREADRTPARALNPSITYYGNVSAISSVTPKMAARQPLSMMAREKPVLFEPPFAKIDLKKRRPLMKGVLAATRRGYLGHFALRWSQTAEIDQGALENSTYRFPPKSKQMASWDLKARFESAEWVLNNCVHAAPFHGAYRCPYCEHTLFCSSLNDLMQHLGLKHGKLAASNFSCPTCMGPVVVTWAKFLVHFEAVHAGALALLVVVDDTAAAVRTGWGLALSAVITAANMWGLSPGPCEAEPDHFVSLFGGYAGKEVGADKLCSWLSAAQEEDLSEVLREQPPPAVARGNDGSKRMRYSIPKNDSLSASASAAPSVRHSRAGTPTQDEWPAAGPSRPYPMNRGYSTVASARPASTAGLEPSNGGPPSGPAAALSHMVSEIFNAYPSGASPQPSETASVTLRMADALLDESEDILAGREDEDPPETGVALSEDEGMD